MRIFVLCIAIVGVLVPAAWCLLELHEGGSLSFASVTAFLPALLAFLIYANMEGPAPPPAAVRSVAPHDLALFAEFQATLPFEPTIRVLREADFDVDYRAEWLAPLNQFVNLWNDPNREFVDATLEAERRGLYRAAFDLAMALARETVPNDRDPEWRTVYPWNQRGGPRPEHVRESARILNDAARAFVPLYERFVRCARERLNPTP